MNNDSLCEQKGNVGMGETAAIAAGIVLYYPDFDEVYDAIKGILEQISYVLIVDNTPEQDISNRLASLERVVYLPNYQNLGMAKALNQLMLKASELGCEWLLSLDQDSVFPANGIEEYRKVLLSVSGPISVVCPFFVNRNSGAIFGRKGFVESCITSGALTSVSSWRDVGCYDEWFYIDLVDFDFCARLRQQGYLIYQTDSVVLSHQIGSPKTIKLLGRNISSSNHSPMRYYYQSRNYLMFKYLHDVETTNSSPMILLVKAVLVDDDKIKKILAIMHGIRDGKKAIKERKKAEPGLN